MMLRLHFPSALAGALILGLTLTSIGAQGTVQATRIPTLTPEQEEILSYMRIVQLSDGQGGKCKAVRFTGVNVQVVNGLGSTATKNGLGNMIVGYLEAGLPLGDDRTGSHNLVGGTLNSYTSWGGMVVGRANTSGAPWASVSGGAGNIAGAPDASVGGGYLNEVTGNYGWAAGGGQNIVWGEYGSACGGTLNAVGGINAAVVGGFGNTSDGEVSTVTGGEGNLAHGPRSAVGGGFNRSAPGSHDWAAGSLLEDF